MHSSHSHQRPWGHLITALLLFLCLTGTLPVQADDTSPFKDRAELPPVGAYVPDQILVRFRDTVGPSQLHEILKGQRLSRVHEIEPLRVQVLRLPESLAVEEAVKVLQQLPEVEFAEPNYIMHTLQVSDPGLANQWAPQRIEAPAAWQIAAGDPSVVIAVVDTGVDYQHSELWPNLWKRKGEVPGNNVDDDGNSYVDDVYGWDFFNNDADPMDDHFHGTHVAGIAAAAPTDNPQGLVGVCPRCRIMPVKVLDSTGSSTLDKVASGIIYAADSGARVINLSLGAAFGGTALEEAVNYAWNKGALVVAAAGNNGDATPVYPAAYANALAVAASNSEDWHSCFSNYGPDYIAVTAPGELIYSSTPRDAAGKDTYGTYSGTSMAAPHVAGLAGLLFAQLPSRTNRDVWNILQATAEDLGSAGVDDFFGHGRINARRAVEGDTSPTMPPTGLFADALSATGYPSARKLVRDDGGMLHWVWQSGNQVLYTVSADGVTWESPMVVFAANAETGQTALAADSDYLYLAFTSKEGSANPRTWFTRKALAGGAEWSEPVVLLGGAYSTAHPTLYYDATTGRLHLVVASNGDGPSVYYTSSADGGQTWAPLRQVSAVSAGSQRTRYVALHAKGSRLFLAVRATEPAFFGLMTAYRVLALHSTDGGETWSAPVELSSYTAYGIAEAGFSLAGVGEQLYLTYAQSGKIYFRRSDDGISWSEPTELGKGAWPSITQADDGQGWVAWEENGSLWLRRYVGGGWDSAESLLTANARSKMYYPNLKLGVSGGLVEWVTTHCSGAPFRLSYDKRALADMPVNYPVTFETESYTVDEGVGIAIIDVVMSEPAQREATVKYATSDGTALAGKDYTAASGTLTFAVGEARQTITVPVKDDTYDEEDQTFTLTLSDPVNALLGAPSAAVVTIADNDPPPVVRLASSYIYVNESAASATVSVRLSVASEFPVAVDFATQDGTATAGADYVAASGTLVFAPGETGRTFVVSILDDLIAEADETVSLALSNPANATLGTAMSTLTLDDNDALSFGLAYYTVKENGGEAVINVKLSAASSYEVRVDYATRDGTATAGMDYTPIAGTLVFVPGEKNKTLLIPIADDVAAEADETILLALSNPVNAELGSPTAVTLTIVDNDTLKFSVASYSVREGAGEAVITVKLSAASDLTVSVNYATSDGTALAGQDYAATSDTLSFAPGETAKTFSVPIMADQIAEASETIKLALANPVNAGLGTPAAATLTILDNDTIRFSLSSYTIKENAGVAVLTVKLSAVSEYAVSVDYATADGTAIAGADYVATSGMLIFAPGETSKSFNVAVLDDTLAEATETILVTLANPTNAGLGTPSTAAVNITDNDSVKFSIAFYSAKENAGAALITVKLSAASDYEVRVDYATSDGTATAGLDYVATSGALTFAPGQTSVTFTVTILDDTLKEGSESLHLVLSNPVNAGLGTPSTATLSISDND